jgi:hypothetical protein
VAPVGLVKQREARTCAKNMEEAVPPPEARLADEVRAMKPSARRKRAKAAGAAEEEIEACAIRGGVNFNFKIKKTPTIHSYTGVENELKRRPCEGQYI